MGCDFNIILQPSYYKPLQILALLLLLLLLLLPVLLLVLQIREMLVPGGCMSVRLCVCCSVPSQLKQAEILIHVPPQIKNK